MTEKRAGAETCLCPAAAAGELCRSACLEWRVARLAHTFRDMIRTRREPVPHPEILEVTAILHAGAKSMQERGRLVALAEVMKRGN